MASGKAITPRRVLFVDQNGALSRAARPLLESGALVNSGPCGSFFEALQRVREQRPDMVVIDLAPPVDALPAIEAIMAHQPTPILAMHATDVPKTTAFRALQMGALDLTARPTDAVGWRELERKLLLLSQVPVVQHIQGKKRSRLSPNDAADRPRFPMVGIAASLGGPKALAMLLRMLPKDFAAPIAICQHISTGFTVELAQWLSFESSLKVVEARHGEPLAVGTVYIAPSGAHLLVTPECQIALDDGAPIQGFKPSCDALLTSTALAFGDRSIGVVLTGMGRDGARGLQEIRNRGGRTIAQDESTSVVFGMPREAIALGAAQKVLPLEEIAPALIRLVNE